MNLFEESACKVLIRGDSIQSAVVVPFLDSVRTR
jgi:hypothetical protein